jgi:hypothetical protein
LVEHGEDVAFLDLGQRQRQRFGEAGRSPAAGRPPRISERSTRLRSSRTLPGQA